jgi:hypothetical protein
MIPSVSPMIVPPPRMPPLLSGGSSEWVNIEFGDWLSVGAGILEIVDVGDGG